MTKKSSAPAIRFKGFTDTWEQRKLGELVDRVVRKNTNNESTLPLTISAQYGLVDQITYFNNRVASRDVSNYYLVLNGEFAYNKSTSDGYPFGAVKRLDLYEKGVLSTLYIVFTPKKEQQIDSDFLTVFFDTDRWHKGVAERAAEGARNHGLLNISAEDFFDIDLSVPKDVSEQKQVGAFIRQLDNLITLHQRKYDKLTNVKKSMLEKMFPKNGSNVPEIRFKGFTEAWEQRKLGDNIIEYTETTTKNNQYPPLTSSRKGIFLQTEYFAGNQIASDDNTGYNIVPYGYFTYRHMSDDEIFHFNINDIVENGIVSTLYPVFTTDENLDSRYLQYQLNYGYEFAKFAILQKQGGSRTYMYLNKLKQLYLTMPKSVEEQNAISAFFMSLDNLITLHQRELEKLKNLKKACLEKMFV